MHEKLTVNGDLHFGTAGVEGVGPSRIALLEHIGASGSISQAARDLGLSYKAAWEAVDAVNNLADTPLVERSVGGRRGGGTQLTPHGRELIAVYRAAEIEFSNFLARLSRGVAHFDHFHELMRGLNMKTSARNQLAAKVKTVTKGAVNSEVILDLDGGDELVAIITNTSVENLALKPGMTAYALIKASWVIVALPDGPRTSARNRLCGTIETLQEGAVNGEVTIALTGGRHITAVITITSMHVLGLKPGMRACALIKAPHVIVAIPT